MRRVIYFIFSNFFSNNQEPVQIPSSKIKKAWQTEINDFHKKTNLQKNQFLNENINEKKQTNLQTFQVPQFSPQQFVWNNINEDTHNHNSNTLPKETFTSIPSLPSTHSLLKQFPFRDPLLKETLNSNTYVTKSIFKVPPTSISTHLPPQVPSLHPNFYNPQMNISHIGPKVSLLNPNISFLNEISQKD